MPKLQRPRLGTHLEWHGATIRVVVRVPPALIPIIGKNKLKEPLRTGSPRDAEVLKWAVIARLKARLRDAKIGRSDDPLVAEALAWRKAKQAEEQALEEGKISFDDAAVDWALDDRAARVRREQGSARADLLTCIATGVATPLGALVDEWLREKEYSGRAEVAFRHAVRLLGEWCAEADVTPSLEAIDRRVAGRFITDRFISAGKAAATTNKAITGLRSYWRWLAQRGHLPEGNPWEKQSVSDKTRERRRKQREPGERDKRPFTNEEAARLLVGITEQPLADFCRVAALTGMRRDEIACLRVKHIRDGIIHVPGTKTTAAVRKVPAHPDLAAIIAERSRGKLPEAFLFHELPEQTSAARGRGSPISQRFTRERRALGVDEVPEGARQSRVDLHSWRRWFIRQAIAALEQGATGFTGWTVADVVGHSNEDGPLGMTFGRYPGTADLKALRACVEAVKLPAACAQDRRAA
jgi:integrase